MADSLIDNYTRVANDGEGNTVYYNDKNQYHRTDGPAFVGDFGVYFYINGELHRENNPAVEWANGTKFWYMHNKRHRINGPAIENADGSVEYWVDGVQMSPESFFAKYGNEKS